MVEINGFDIAVTRGDSLYLRIDLDGRDLPEGSQAVFTVKKNVRSDEELVRFIADASSESLTIALSPEQTNLDPGVYVWDVRILIPLPSGDREVYTPMQYAAFAVMDAVGSVEME